MSANRFQPFTTPSLLNVWPEDAMHPTAKQQLSNSFAANSDAAYSGYVEVKYMSMDCMIV